MIKKTIKTTEGIHAQIASEIVKNATLYNVEMFLAYENKIIDMKSILGLMSLAVPSGDNVIIMAEGAHAEEAVNAVLKAIK